MLDMRRRRWSLLLIGGIWLILSLNWVLAVARFQPNVLYQDQWDFLLPMFEGKGAWDRFIQQHGPHRQGLAFVIEGWILEASAWDARYESLWVAAMLIVATLLALRLKWKMVGTLTAWDAWIPIMGLSLGQFETIIGIPNASVGTFPLALILLAANLWLTPNAAVRYLSAGALSFVLTFTGFGFIASAVITAVIAVSIVRHALQRNRESSCFALGGLLVSGAGWFRFFSDYAFQPGVEGFRFPWTPWTDYLRFVTLMFTLPAGQTRVEWSLYLFGTTLSVLVLFAAVAIGWSWLKRHSSKNDVLMLLMGSGVGYAVATAIGRVPLGMTGALAPRYLTLMFPMWLALYLGAVEWRRRWAYVSVAACVWILALAPYQSMAGRPLREWSGTVEMGNDQVYAATVYGTSKAQWARIYLASASINAAQGAVVLPVYPDPLVTRLGHKLRYLCEHRLSFFAGNPADGDYLPWLDPDRHDRPTDRDQSFQCESTSPKQNGAFTGFVFEDADGDMTSDGDERRMSRIVVQLQTPDGRTILDSVETDHNGAFVFPDRAPGGYRLAVVLPDGYERTSDDSFVTSVNSDGTSNEARFGLTSQMHGH